MMDELRAGRGLRRPDGHRLRRRGPAAQLGRRVIGVDFGGKPTDEKFQNKRAEMWWLLAKWMETASIPNLPELQAELTAIQYTYANAQGRLQLESKEDLKKRGLPSPDLADALALTFAEPVPHPAFEACAASPSTAPRARRGNHVRHEGTQAAVRGSPWRTRPGRERLGRDRDVHHAAHRTEEDHHPGGHRHLEAAEGLGHDRHRREPEARVEHPRLGDPSGVPWAKFAFLEPTLANDHEATKYLDDLGTCSSSPFRRSDFDTEMQSALQEFSGPGNMVIIEEPLSRTNGRGSTSPPSRCASASTSRTAAAA